MFQANVTWVKYVSLLQYLKRRQVGLESRLQISCACVWTLDIIVFFCQDSRKRPASVHVVLPSFLPSFLLWVTVWWRAQGSSTGFCVLGLAGPQDARSRGGTKKPCLSLSVYLCTCIL